MKAKNPNTMINTLLIVIHTRMSLNTITSRGKLTKSGTRSVTKEKVGRKNKSKGGGKTTPMSMTRTMLGEM
tara:strand:+ start:695 stop:907 length:213 start_codon:yes stop_codon:yes gene_type:complete